MLELGVVARVGNQAISEPEKGRSENQSQPWQQSKFDASLGYINIVLKCIYILNSTT